MQNETVLDLRILGGFSLTVGSVLSQPLRTRKGQWLLSILALREGRHVERQTLAGMLWPDSLEEQSLSNLRRTLTDLRSAMGGCADRIVARTNRSLALELQPGDFVDISEFRALLKSATEQEPSDPAASVAALTCAIELYSGPLLEGCDEHWAYQERQHTELMYLDALERLSALHLKDAQMEAAIALLKRTLTVDPLREHAQRDLMRAYAANSDLASAVQVYRDYRILVRRELNINPDADTQALYEQIKTAGSRVNVKSPPEQPTVTVQVDDQKPAREWERVIGRVPRPITPLIGRQRETATIVRLQEDSRLVTLTGPGGIGKTRLAIHIADSLSINDEFTGGVWFADLSGLTMADELSSFVATTLSLGDTGTDPPLDRLTGYIARQRLMLILDNCEHLTDACAHLTRALLSACPNLFVLATSREPLGITGERRWVVPPLAMPEPVIEGALELSDVSRLMAFDSVRLLVERGKEQRSDFDLTPRNAGTVSEICRSLDGIPLALELAAARLNVLTVEQISTRLKDRFTLLTRGSRSAWPRQQTLLALIDWSHDLLLADEKVLFRRLAVFSGGFTLEDVEAICSGAESILADRQLDLLTSLLDKSLVQSDTEIAGERRYRMLESIRAFAMEQLELSGEHTELSRTHAHRFLEVATTSNAGIYSSTGEISIRRMHSERDNFDVALNWCLKPDNEPETALKLAVEMGRFWYLQNMYRTGLMWLRTTLQGAPSEDTDLLAKAYNLAGSYCWAMAYFSEAKNYWEQTLALRRQQNDPLGIGYSLQNLGLVAMHQGEYTLSRNLIEESIAILRENCDPGLLATPLNNLAIIAKDMGDFSYAHDLLTESFQIHQRTQNRTGMASVLVARGNLERRQGRPDDALISMTQALKLNQEVGDRQGCAIVLHNMGEMAQHGGDIARARQLYDESMAISTDVMDRRQTATTLFNIGQLARAEGNLEESLTVYRKSVALAVEINDRTLIVSLLIDQCEHFPANEGKGDLCARTLGAITGTIERFGTPITSKQKAVMERVSAATRLQVGELSFAQQFAIGRGLSLEYAIDQAVT